MKFSYAPRNELSVLRPKIQNDNFLCHGTKLGKRPERDKGYCFFTDISLDRKRFEQKIKACGSFYIL
jgi:hypothetical protein